jgi:hypothetical protein
MEPWPISGALDHAGTMGYRHALEQCLVLAGSGTDDVNSFTLQYFINYNMPGGSYFTSQPIITANWGADSGDKWTIPFGGGLGKIFKLGGKQPVNFNIQAYYNVKRPEFGGRWQLRLQWAFLFPK